RRDQGADGSLDAAWNGGAQASRAAQVIMASVLLGIAALVLLLWALNAFTKTDPRVAARVLKTSAGTAALAGAVIFVALGRVGIALPLGIAGLVLLGLWPGGMGFGRRQARKSPGQISRVRSAFLEMELDHDT